MTELQLQILELHKELQEKILNEYNILIEAKISFDLKSSRVLGAYYPVTNKIRLDNELLEEFKEVYIKEVFAHEFAHAAVDTLFNYRVKAHGKEFKKICNIFEISSKASTSSFKNSEVLKLRKNKKNINKKTFIYKCECQTFELSIIRHNKIQNNKSSYICKKCKGKIKLV